MNEQAKTIAKKLLFGLIASKTEGRMTYQFKKDLWEFSVPFIQQHKFVKENWADYDECLRRVGMYWGRTDSPWKKVDMDKLARDGKPAYYGLYHFYKMCVVSIPYQVASRQKRALSDSNMSRNINPSRSITETK